MTDILWKSQRNGVVAEEVDHKAEQQSLLDLRTWRKLGGLALEPSLEDEYLNSNEEIPEVILKSARKYLDSSSKSQLTKSS
ncbi:hypothetical protein K7432_011230 [Basidiobolus ranarum]|uniref:Uncharacterized protein n=1 Tax=Basidiobolus ranarum TaxID=34480 RepID=A0ABR2VU91_9FUNG